VRPGCGRWAGIAVAHPGGAAPAGAGCVPGADHSGEGLPALSLDALTSVAYWPEAIIAVLAVAGAGAVHLVLPITIAIAALLTILVFSNRQVIDAYPGGGA